MMRMMGSFYGWLMGRPHCLEVRQILAAISSASGGRDGVCVMVRSSDVLMDVGMAKTQAANSG